MCPCSYNDHRKRSFQKKISKFLCNFFFMFIKVNPESNTPIKL